MPPVVTKKEAIDYYSSIASFLVGGNNLSAEIEMDGGIDLSNLKRVLGAGVGVVVAGSSIFGADVPPAEATRMFLS